MTKEIKDNKEKDLLYIAGGLFSEAEVRQRTYEKKVLTEKFGEDLEIFNPHSDNEANDKSKQPTATDIFTSDTERIINSRYIFAELDNEDVGVCAELAIAFTLNLVLEYAKETIVESKDSDEAVARMLYTMEQVPYKKVFAHLSDIRTPNAGDYEDYYVPKGFNQFVIGMTELIGTISPSTDKAMEELKLAIQEDKE